MRRLFGRLAVIPLVLTLAGCEGLDFDSESDRYREDFHYSYPLPATGTVQVANRNGSIEISGWDKNEIEIDGTKHASSQSRLHEIKIDVNTSASSVTVRTVPPPDRFGHYGVSYMIHVPRRARLDRIASSNGSIRATNIEGDAFVRTSNGSVHATQLRGMLDIQTTNGSVELTDVSGDTTIHTSNGGIRGDVKKGGLEAKTRTEP